MAGYRPLDLTGVRTRPIASRAHRVRVEDFARPWQPGGGLPDFMERLPRTLRADDLREIVEAISASVRHGKPVILAMGAHVIKCGLSPVVIDLIRRRVVSAVALNGGGAIHDLELALFGGTSEDVAGHLRDGRYGMVAETGEALQRAIRSASDGPDGVGLGGALGRWLHGERAPNGDLSILQSAYEAGIPATVHVAIGTDTVHMLPGVDAGRIGALSHYDFRLLAAVVAGLVEGGAHLNCGSAVVLPEVFLKCVTLCRNLGHPIGGFTTVDLDMVRHYRPMTNVVERHAALGARGYALTGHHEIMLPLLAAAVIERLEGGCDAIAATNGIRDAGHG
jgi:hypothetical protein